MNNWRLLLLAVVVVVQPIGSFTESNLFDGRECCERSEDSRLYGYRKTEERRSLDGNREDRRLRTLDAIHDERRYESIRGPMLTRLESLERSERRITLEHRLIRDLQRRHQDTRNRESRDDLNRDRDESRNILGKNERGFSESRNRYTLDAARTVRLSRDAKDTRSIERESRNTVSRLPIRISPSSEERRILPKRETAIISREPKDITRSGTRSDSRLSVPDSRIQPDDIRDGRVFDRRTQEDGTELRQSSFSNTRINDKARVVRAQLRSVEQNVRQNRESREVRVELRRYKHNTEIRGIVNAVRDSKISADRMRQSKVANKRLVRGGINIRDNERINERRQHGDESRRSMDLLRNTAERHLDTRETRSSKNADQMERRSVSINRLSMLRESRDRLSSSSERNTHDERVALIRDHSRINERRQDESRRSMDLLRNTAERHLDSRETRSSKNADQMERRSVSMDRLSILRESRDRLSSSSDRNTLDEMVPKTRDHSRINERRQHDVESRRSMDLLRDTVERRLESRQTRFSKNDDQMERRSASMDRLSMLRESRDRLSSSSERNTHDERVAETRDHSRINERRQQGVESTRTMDLLRNTAERRLESRQTKFSKNDDQMERRSVSMDRLSLLRESRDRLSSSSERNTRDERVGKIRDITNQRSDERTQERESKLILRERTTNPSHESDKTTRGIVIKEYSEDRRQQRKARDHNQQRPESRVTDTSKDARESLQEQRQQREVNRLSRAKPDYTLREARDTERMQQLHRNIRKSSEERTQRENNRLSRDSLRQVQDNNEQQSGRSARAFSEFKQQRDINRLSIRRDVKGNEDLRRQVLERSMERARLSQSAERRNNIRKNSRGSRSVETIIRKDTKNHERDERRQATSQRLGTRGSSEIESFRVERGVRSIENHQARPEMQIPKQETRSVRLDARKTSRAETTRLENFITSRADMSENERRDTQREERDDDKTRILAKRRSNERMFAQRGLNNRSTKNIQKILKKRGEVRSERDLSERRQEIRDANRDSRNVRGEVRSASVAGRRQENRESRNVREIRMNDGMNLLHQHDSTRNSRARSLQRQSRGNTEQLTERPRTSAARAEAQNYRATSKNDRLIDSTRTADARPKSKSDVRTDKAMTMDRMYKRDNRFANDEKREETRLRNINDVTFRDTLVKASGEYVHSSWQIVFQTLQGVYLCGLLMQMLTENPNKIKKRSFNWWFSPKNLIKVD